jgi:hypothetical protein
MQNGEYRVAANELFVKMTALDGILLSLGFLQGKQRSLKKTKYCVSTCHL